MSAVLVKSTVAFREENPLSLHKVHGIVARYANYREYDRMLTILTPEMGSVDAVAYACRRSKSPLLACTQPFSYGEFILQSKKDKYSLAQCDLRESFYDLRNDLARLSAATFVADSCAQLAHGSPANELFGLAYYTLSFLCYGESAPIDLLLCFFVKILYLQGYEPATTACARCGASTFENPVFNSGQGGALCSSCGAQHGGEPIKPLSLEAVRRMMQLPLERMDAVRLPAEVREELLSALPAYFECHFERKLKPLDFIREFCK